MSYVLLLAADRPLPLCDCQEMRTTAVKAHGTVHTISCMRGFKVSEHSYYRSAVDELGHAMKAHQYELCVERHGQDLQNLRDYLEENLSPGESVELWNLWVGIDRSRHVAHYRGRLADFDMDTLEQFCSPPDRDGLPGQCRMTVII